MQITVYSTKVNKKATISTTVTTWGALKSKLIANGIFTNDMKAIIQSTKVTLEHDEAVLPTSDFTLHLFPTMNKSGADTDRFEEIKDELSSLFDELSDKIDELIDLAEDMEDSELTELKATAEKIRKGLNL